MSLRWLWALALLLAPPAFGADPRDRGPDSIDVSSYPQKYQDIYNNVFTVRCSKCHSLARAINARLKTDEWVLYVKKMKRRPGSGISEANAEKIVEFLKYYSSEGKEKPAGN